MGVRKSTNPIMDEIRVRMKKDKWYIKLKRKFHLHLWLVYCLLFNNGFVNKIKRKVTK